MDEAVVESRVQDVQDVMTVVSCPAVESSASCQDALNTALSGFPYSLLDVKDKQSPIACLCV